MSTFPEVTTYLRPVYVYETMTTTPSSTEGQIFVDLSLLVCISSLVGENAWHSERVLVHACASACVCASVCVC